jgi:GT2 family glycosyltransferase
VILTGPNREILTLQKSERKILPNYYMRYVPRYLKVLKQHVSTQLVQVKPVQYVSQSTMPQLPLPRKIIVQPNKQLFVAKSTVKPINRSTYTQPSTLVQVNKGIGRPAMSIAAATQYYQEVVGRLTYPISNDIGVGILSYNRIASIRRLIESIRKYTDLYRTTIFISDESTNPEVSKYLSTITDMVVMTNQQRLGVAGNTNRLLRCLSRFRYKILLNDDVEILRMGWEKFYFDVMLKTGYHHFCARQLGVYNTSDVGTASVVNGITITTIQERPQGAVLALDNVAFDKVGYFDEMYGLYGMEHVDWSRRVSNSHIQPLGYHDANGSNQYFRLCPDSSVVENRSALLATAKQKFKQVKADLYVSASEKTIVPNISCIIPFQIQNRSEDMIHTVFQNIKGQRFPIINIVLSEQDNVTKINLDNFFGGIYIRNSGIKATDPFNKAIAFNAAMSLCKTDKIVLQDADILVQVNYFKTIYSLLNQYNGVHIGKNVLYLNQESSVRVAQSCVLSKDYTIGRTVGYFEGGSLGCNLRTYINIGGFNEQFVGYGCFCPGGNNYVLTNYGYVPIENVKDGDLVYTHENCFKRARTHVRQYDGEILNIFIPGRLPIKGVTPEHPFLVRNGNKFIWKPANKLNIGDEISSTDFMPELVKPYNFSNIKISSLKYRGSVYNLEVEDDHSYVVNGLVVHNCEDLDFFYRLLNYPKFYNVRTEEFIHLWHDRTPGWKGFHEINKKLEIYCRKRPLEQYMKELREYLNNKYKFILV